MSKDANDQVTQVKEALDNISTQLNKNLEERFEKIKQEGQASVKDTDTKISSLESQYEQLSKEFKESLAELSKKAGRFDGGEGDHEEFKDIGTQVIESETFKSYATDGRNRRVTIDIKDITTLPASAGALLTPQRLRIWQPPREAHIRDLIPSGTTSKDTLILPRRKTWTNNAASVAEGARKPQSEMTFDSVSTPIIKLAHYVRATDEILDDAPAIRSYINAQLIDGLRDVEDAQILKGDGTTGNMEGLYTVAQEYDRNQPGDTLVDTMRRVQTQLRLANRNCTGYVMNPEDWESIVLLKGTDNHYLWVTVPNGEGGTRLMAKPVRDTTKLAKGEWLAGDFRRGAQLFDRKRSAISISTENEDNFVVNKVTILAEERLGLVIYDALSFVKNAPA